jgi:hypothetical protein
MLGGGSSGWGTRWEDAVFRGSERAGKPGAARLSSVWTAVAAAVVGAFCVVAALSLSTIAASATSSPAAPERFQLAPFKDEHFAYPRIIKTDYGGDFVMVEFTEERDINGRDEVPLKKAFDRMVDLSVNDHKQDLLFEFGTNPFRYLAVGKAQGGAKVVVIFMHGWHGDRTLAMEDLRFGGNFNRLKNLMVRNDGVYISPDFTGFAGLAKNQMKALIKHHAEVSPGAPIILGCASTSCKITYRLLEDPESAALLSGVVMFGGGKYEPFLETATFRDPAKWVPFYIGHGSADKTNNWVTLEIFYKAIKKAQPAYPIKYDLFVGGVHGTPIRMADWRMVLNWMIAYEDG